MSIFDFLNRGRPVAPTMQWAQDEARRQTAANAAAYRPQRMNPQDMQDSE